MILEFLIGLRLIFVFPPKLCLQAAQLAKSLCVYLISNKSIDIFMRIFQRHRIGVAKGSCHHRIEHIFTVFCNLCIHLLQFFSICLNYTGGYVSWAFLPREPYVCLGSLIEEDAISVALAVPAFITDAPPNIVAYCGIFPIDSWASLHCHSDIISCTFWLRCSY